MDVYEGVWVQRGVGWASTLVLTVNTRYGTYLQSFITFFVTVVGSFLWQLIVFGVHQIRSSRVKTGKRYNGNWHANMVILRNSGSPTSLILEILRAWKAWHKSASDLSGTLSFLSIATVTSALVAVASIFTARVKITGIRVGRVESTSCGPWVFREQLASAAQMNFNDTVMAANYAETCYYGSKDPTVCCNQFVQAAIPWVSDANAPCPFESSICRTAAYQMDTGLVDTRRTLGLNTKDKDRLFYRRVSTCAPLHTGSFEEEGLVPVNDGAKYDTYDNLYLGPLINGSQVLANYTFRYNEDAIYDQSGYQLTSVYYNAGTDSNFWQPIEELNRTDADISVFFLTQGFMRYTSPCFDPMFLANQSVSFGEYESFYWVTTMGCTDQHQICLDANATVCTPLLGSLQAADWLSSSLTMTPGQSAVLERLNNTLQLSTLQQSVLGRGSNALQATSSAIYQLGTWEQYSSLPATQWTTEVSSWFAVQLATLQRSMVLWVSGSITPYVGGVRLQPSLADTTSRDLCSQQLIPLPSGYDNFRFGAIILILAVGITIIVLAIVVPSRVIEAKKKKKSTNNGWVAWTLDAKLQLHRMAQQGHGFGNTWINQLDDVPTTEEEIVPDSSPLARTLGRYLVSFEGDKPSRWTGQIESADGQSPALPPMAEVSSSNIPLLGVTPVPSLSDQSMMPNGVITPDEEERIQ